MAEGRGSSRERRDLSATEGRKSQHREGRATTEIQSAPSSPSRWRERPRPSLGREKKISLGDETGREGLAERTARSDTNECLDVLLRRLLKVVESESCSC
jgi:hypothetical protein